MHIYVYIYIYIPMCVYVYVYVHVHIYIYTYISYSPSLLGGRLVGPPVGRLRAHARHAPVAAAERPLSRRPRNRSPGRPSKGGGREFVGILRLHGAYQGIKCRLVPTHICLSLSLRSSRRRQRRKDFGAMASEGCHGWMHGCFVVVPIYCLALNLPAWRGQVPK